MMEAKSEKGNSSFRWLAVLLLLPGLLLAGWRCHLRLAVEENDLFIEAAVDYEEVKVLSRAQGLETRMLLASMAAEGIGSVGIAEDTLPALEAEGRISILSVGDRERLAEVRVRSGENGLLERIARILNFKAPGLAHLENGTESLVLQGTGSGLPGEIGVGFSEKPFAEIASLGLGVILRPLNHPGMTASGIRGLIETWPAPGSLSAIVFAEEEVLGARGDGKAAIDALRERSRGSVVPDRLGQVEFLDQSGMPELLAGLGRALPVVRVHSIGRKELDHNYDVSRATARWIRAVRDRRLKLLYVRFFLPQPKPLMCVSPDPILQNLGYVRGIVQGLQSAGFSIAKTDGQRRQELRASLGPVPSWARIPMAVALLTGLLLLVGFSRRRGLSVGSCIGWSAANVVVSLLAPPTVLVGVAGVIGAISFSTLGGIWAIRSLEERHPGEKLFPAVSWANWAGFMVRLVIPSLLGGILIAGLHAENTYLLHIEQFRGIKLAFIVPLLWIGIWSLRRYGSGLQAILTHRLTMRDLVLALFVLGGTALYLARSGNVTFLKPSPTEDIIRTWLEDLLVARPRNKEFLIGYPAALFFLYFQARAARVWLPLWAFFLTMGQVSMLNTFCHFHSPLAMAFLRGWNGLWTGLLIGGAALAGYQVCRILAGLGHRDGDGVLLGYFGHGNLGDELLWRTFADQARQERPELSWRVLMSTPIDEAWPSGVRPLYRSHHGELLEVLSNARCVVIPGGGVLQAVTSSRSLWYYSLIAAVGTVGGGCLLLPAQGMGPWQASGDRTAPAGLLKTLLGWLVGRAGHLTLRDASSRESFELLESGVPAVVETDAVFLMTPPETGKPALGARFRVGAVLRGSQPRSAEIARALSDWARAQGLELTPLVFQPGEDEEPWRGVPDLAEPRIIRAGDSLWRDVGDFDLLIVMRLHGAILSTIAGIPWFGLTYDPKLEGLARDLDWPYVISPEKFAIEAVLPLMNEVRGSRDQLSGRLRQAAAARRERARGDISRCLKKIPSRI